MNKKILSFLLLLALLGAVIPPVAAAAAEPLKPIAAFVSGEEYVLSIKGINDYQGPVGDTCVVAKEAQAYGLDYAKRPETVEAAKNCLWTITQVEPGIITVYSASAKKYLHMEADAASLSDQPQNLNAEISGSQIKIFIKEGGEIYYLRFTNLYKTYSCWHAGTGTSSNVFTMYSTREVATPKEYDNEGQTPLYSVACFADLHVDYGIQSWKTPIRKGTVKAVEFLRDELGGANVILVGGDILSENDTAAQWTDKLIKNSMDTVYKTLLEGSTDSIVLPVTGNHDSEAGNAAGGTVYSGDWEEYLDDWVGEYDAFLRNEDSKFKELLGYRYHIDGLEFIGINTPYLSSKGSGLYASQADWLEEQLEEIGPDKTVLVFCHYPVQHSQYPVTALGGGDARGAMAAVLEKYPNVLYFYGHVHHNDQEYAWYSSAELIRPTGTVTLNPDNSYQTNGYVACHMGSMGYYDNQFQPGGLLADEPQIVQFLKVDFYEDHITFR